MLAVLLLILLQQLLQNTRLRTVSLYIISKNFPFPFRANFSRDTLPKQLSPVVIPALIIHPLVRHDCICMLRCCSCKQAN
jgi:hypothetical protein